MKLSNWPYFTPPRVLKCFNTNQTSPVFELLDDRPIFLTVPIPKQWRDCEIARWLSTDFGIAKRRWCEFQWFGSLPSLTSTFRTRFELSEWTGQTIDPPVFFVQRHHKWITTMNDVVPKICKHGGGRDTEDFGIVFGPWS